MLYTVIDLYEVLRTDDVYSSEHDNYIKVCTDPYSYL